MKKLNRILAFDVGGTKIAHAIVSREGKIITPVEKAMTPPTAAATEALFSQVIAQYEREIDAVAFSTAGAVDNQNKKIIGGGGNMPIGYMDIDFPALSDKPVFLENDANCAVWAEYKVGNAKGFENIVMLTLGTGVGLGIIVDGVLLKGKSGAAGETHFRVRHGNHRRCACGNYDCMEIYTSGKALNIEAKEVYQDDKVTSYDVIEGMKKGDKRAVHTFENWQNYVADAAVTFADIFDPDIILLGGSMAQFIDYGKVEKEANQKIVVSPFILRQARFENNAGIIGAALRCVWAAEGRQRS